MEKHTLRYAKVDFLYWFEFQNRCHDMLTAYIASLDAIKSSKDLLASAETQRLFVSRLRTFETIVLALFDILNCDKCSNVSFFALSEELFEIFGKLTKVNVIGVAFSLSKVVELFDSLLILSATCKAALKFKGPNDLPQLRPTIVAHV